MAIRLMCLSSKHPNGFSLLWTDATAEHRALLEGWSCNVMEPTEAIENSGRRRSLIGSSVCR